MLRCQMSSDAWSLITRATPFFLDHAPHRSDILSHLVLGSAGPQPLSATTMSQNWRQIIEKRSLCKTIGGPGRLWASPKHTTPLERLQSATPPFALPVWTPPSSRCSDVPTDSGHRFSHKSSSLRLFPALLENQPDWNSHPRRVACKKWLQPPATLASTPPLCGSGRSSAALRAVIRKQTERLSFAARAEIAGTSVTGCSCRSGCDKS